MGAGPLAASSIATLRHGNIGSVERIALLLPGKPTQRMSMQRAGGDAEHQPCHRSLRGHQAAAWAMVGSIVSDGGQSVAAKQMMLPVSATTQQYRS